MQFVLILLCYIRCNHLTAFSGAFMYPPNSITIEDLRDTEKWVLKYKSYPLHIIFFVCPCKACKIQWWWSWEIVLTCAPPPPPPPPPPIHVFRVQFHPGHVRVEVVVGSLALLWGYSSKPNISKCTVPENIHTHPKEGRWTFRGGEESQKPNVSKESMKLNWKFQGGGGFQTKNLPWLVWICCS